MGAPSKDRRLDHELDVHGGAAGRRRGRGDANEAEKDVGVLMPEQLNSAWEDLGATISSGFGGSQAGIPMKHSSDKSVGQRPPGAGPSTPRQASPISLAVQTADWHPEHIK